MLAKRAGEESRITRVFAPDQSRSHTLRASREAVSPFRPPSGHEIPQAACVLVERVWPSVALPSLALCEAGQALRLTALAPRACGGIGTKSVRQSPLPKNGSGGHGDQSHESRVQGDGEARGLTPARLPRGVRGWGATTEKIKRRDSGRPLFLERRDWGRPLSVFGLQAAGTEIVREARHASDRSSLGPSVQERPR